MNTADTAIVREFLHVVTAQAKAAIKGDDNPGAQGPGQKFSGLLQLLRLHPSSEELVPTRFTLDDVAGMITTAVSDAENGHNVYIEARLVRPGLQGKERGKFTDTTAVFALVVDSDNDKGMAWEPNVPVSLTVETSPGNYHYWFFLRQAVSAEVGKQLGERIRKAVGADHDSGNVVQPYRVAGTINYPSKTKIERGRVTVETRIVDFTEALWTPEEIEQAFPLPDPKGGGNGGGNGGADEGNIPADTMQVIRDGVEDGQRSGAFWNVMIVLKRRGFTMDGILALLERYPDGIAKKYRGRLRDEVERAYGKIKNETAAQQAGQTDGLGEWDAGEDPGAIPPRQWLLGNQFCRSFISSIVAAGGAGKSALRLLQFISLATGRSLCGQNVFRRCRVLLISLEDDRDELQRRIKAVLDYYNRVLCKRGEPGIGRSDLKGWLFCASPKLAKLAEMKDRERSTGPLERYIRDAVERRQPDLVSLDPFVKTHSLEENDSGDMDFVCDLLARMAVEFGIAVDSPHHAHKGQMSPGDADSGRGSSGIRDAGRLVYTLTPMSENEAKLFNIPLEERWAYVRLDSAKVNIAARSGKAEWFHIVGQNIGNDTKEYPNGDTVQVVEPWSPPDAWKDTTNDTLNAILNDIEQGLVDDNGNPTGQRYSNAPRAADRAVWPVVKKHYPDKSEAECRTIIHKWLETKLLYPEDYDDPVERKKRKGLRVDSTKRPGTTDDIW